MAVILALSAASSADRPLAFLIAAKRWAVLPSSVASITPRPCLPKPVSEPRRSHLPEDSVYGAGIDRAGGYFTLVVGEFDRRDSRVVG